MADYVLSDTSVLARLTKRSDDSHAYNAWLGEKRLAINDQIKVELLSYTDFRPARKQRIDELVRACLFLPMSEATHLAYARVIVVRDGLRKAHVEGEGAGEGDVWVIASAVEFGLALFSHDRQQVQLARATSRFS